MVVQATSPSANSVVYYTEPSSSNALRGLIFVFNCWLYLAGNNLAAASPCILASHRGNCTNIRPLVLSVLLSFLISFFDETYCPSNATYFLFYFPLPSRRRQQIKRLWNIAGSGILSSSKVRAATRSKFRECKQILCFVPSDKTELLAGERYFCMCSFCAIASSTHCVRVRALPIFLLFLNHLQLSQVRKRHSHFNYLHSKNVIPPQAPGWQMHNYRFSVDKKHSAAHWIGTLSE